MSEAYGKKIIFTSQDGAIVYDYSAASYAIKTTKEWYSTPKNQSKLKDQMKNARYNSNLTEADGTSFKGWVVSKKSNPLDKISEILNS